MFVVATIIEKGTAGKGGPLLNFKCEETGMIGIMPVFETREQAEVEFPDKKIYEVEACRENPDAIVEVDR